MRFIIFGLFLIGFLLSDVYTLKAFQTLFPEFFIRNGRLATYLFWGFKILLWAALLGLTLSRKSLDVKKWVLIGFFSIYGGQIIVLMVSLGDEIRRGITYLAQFFSRSSSAGGSTILSNPSSLGSATIPRSEFLAKTGLGLGSLAFLGLSTQSSRGLYDYRVRRVNLVLPNLPSAFEGIKLVQISDIHSGSFYNPTAVLGGVELILGLKPDIIFFTGDLVNNRADEMKDYQSIFSKLKAPLGVYSILGNHDYGDYSWWPSELDKKNNLLSLMQIHKLMGYDLLMNANRTITIGGQSISIVGVENWSAHSQFPKHGRLDLAIKGTEESAVRLLLSHDPSHWRAQIIPEFSKIEATFSGHTHGMQFGLRLPNFQWSPVQYMYPEWAGLYQEKEQQLYVNVGYGFIGYPGRIGMNPEITLFTLTSRN